MLFNSYIFIFLFFPLTVAGYYFLSSVGRNEWAKVELIVMSLWFYGYYNMSYLLVICGSIVINYIISRALLRCKYGMIYKKVILALGILFNVGLIFYYKYYDFFIANINAIFKTDYVMRHIILPLGISFYTFQQISYVIDTYRGETRDYTFFEYVLFVTFFPQLVAGPIVLHNEIIPQFRDKANMKINYANWNRGLIFFVFGLTKKILIADTFGKAVEWGYSNIALMGTLDAVIVILSYTLQIYFDFSGYCDMAAGIALFFNIQLPRNFNSPYKAKSVIEFWERWHMTLNRFLKQYVYIPLGGSRKGKLKTYVNVMIVFLVSGIWHGANWTFIIWGCLHGIANVLERVLGQYLERINKYLRQGITFIFVNIAWVFFRASSLREAGEVLSRLCCMKKGISQGLVDCFITIEWKAIQTFLPFVSRFGAGITVLMLGVGNYIVLRGKNIYEIDWKIGSRHLGMEIAVLLTWCVMSLSGISTFLYFNF